MAIRRATIRTILHDHRAAGAANGRLILIATLGVMQLSLFNANIG
jgi:hypothetical protein